MKNETKRWIAFLLVLFLVILTFLALPGCRNVEKNVLTEVTEKKFDAEGKVVGETTTKTVDKSTDKGFTLGFSEGDSKVIDMLDVNVSGIKGP
jgi:hypothetical protein